MSPLNCRLRISSDSGRDPTFLIPLKEMLTASSDGDAGPEGCWTEVVALLPGVEVVLVAPTAAVVERNTPPELGVEAPSGQCLATDSVRDVN